MCEARNSSGALLNQYCPLGETISGTNYFYTTDHLGISANIVAETFSQSGMVGSHPTSFDPVDHSGSVREMANGSGTVQAQYAYDPYGKVTQLQGSLLSDFQYAGYYFHSPSGLNLVFRRVYSSSLGRWISRDPIEEFGSINLYVYANNDVVRWTDPSGLAPHAPIVPPFEPQVPTPPAQPTPGPFEHPYTWQLFPPMCRLLIRRRPPDVTPILEPFHYPPGGPPGPILGPPLNPDRPPYDPIFGRPRF
jgi:RHS repeat-associated protein